MEQPDSCARRVAHELEELSAMYWQQSKRNRLARGPDETSQLLGQVSLKIEALVLLVNEWPKHLKKQPKQKRLRL